MTTAYRSIYVTARDESEAKKIAQTLVEEKLAACANIFPIFSIYRWNDAIEKSPEAALILKTRADVADAAVARIKALHSYEVPCIVVWQIESGYAPYLQWIDESTKKI